MRQLEQFILITSLIYGDSLSEEKAEPLTPSAILKITMSIMEQAYSAKGIT